MTLHTLNSPLVDAIILTAISLEFDAVLQVDDGSWPGSEWVQKETRAGLPIAFRTFRGQGNQPLQVAVAQAGDMGGSGAAITLSPLVERYQPSCIAMTGVCAGRPGKTNLGDVVAADRLYFHDTGKDLPEGVQKDLTTYNLRPDWKIAIERFDFRTRFKNTRWWRERPIPYEWQENWVLAQLNEGIEAPHLLPECTISCPQWTTVIENLWRTGDIQQGRLLITERGELRVQRVLIQHKNVIPDLSPLGDTLPFEVHVAPIGTGNKVVENKEIWGFVSEYMRKTLGLEMEAAAVGQVAHSARYPGPSALVMKGVMDFADHGRDDHFKDFAARAAAECLIAFLRERGEVRSAGYETFVHHETDNGIAPTYLRDLAPKPSTRAPIQRALSIPRPPPKRDHEGQAPLLPAQRVAAAALLGNWAPDEGTFLDACTAAGIPRDLFWAASSSSDRWFSAIMTAAQEGVLRHLLDSASQSLPPELRWRIKSTNFDAGIYIVKWDRESLREYRLASATGKGSGDANEPDALGFSALRRAWGTGEPELAALRRYLDETEDEPASTIDNVDNSLAVQIDEMEIQLGLAAEHLLAWCEKVDGEQLLTWTLKHVDHLPPAKATLIAAVVNWWGAGRKWLVDEARAIRDQPLDMLTREAINSAVSRLSSLDRLLCEADAAWWGPSETPPSVQLAIRGGRLFSVAALLEAVGERRPSIFIEQIEKLYHNKEAVVALTRALRRLRISGLEGEPRDPELRLALQSSLPEATAAEIGATIQDHRKRALWLELLSPPLSDNQIKALIKVHANARNAPERDRARRWLCTTLDPLMVWQNLPAAQRKQWVEELTDFELLLVAPLVDTRPPDDSSERQDWARLESRVAVARKLSTDLV